jgi:hypothetical protein
MSHFARLAALAGLGVICPEPDPDRNSFSRTACLVRIRLQMFNRNHNDPSIHKVEARLRAASPEVSDLDLDRLKRRIQTQISARRSTRGASLRHRLIPALVSLSVLGGTGIFAVEALAVSATGQQYTGPGGGSIVIQTCVLSNGGHTLTVSGTTTDSINSITVSDTAGSPTVSTTVTPTGSSFSAVYVLTGTKFSGAYTFQAVQNLGGTATANCTV